MEESKTEVKSSEIPTELLSVMLVAACMGAVILLIFQNF